jgi:hypothetical protein
MSQADMKIYDDEIYTTAIELLGQKLDVFNAAAGNTVVLNMMAWRGSYSKEAFYQTLAGALRRVDRNAPITTASATDLAQGEVVGVKVAGGFGPVKFEPSQITWLNEDPEAAIAAIAEGFADALLADQLNTAVGSAVAAVENQAALVNDVSALTAGAGALTQKVINSSHFKFGDANAMIRADIMHSAGNEALINNALDNGERLFESSNVTIVSILGKIMIVSDIPALLVAGTPNKSKVLSVVVGGIIVDNASDIITNMETSNGNTRIETTWQADYSFGLKLKGYSWDVSAGDSPVDADLFTGSNWLLAMSDVKHTLGTLAVADADQ